MDRYRFNWSKVIYKRVRTNPGLEDGRDRGYAYIPSPHCKLDRRVELPEQPAQQI